MAHQPILGSLFAVLDEFVFATLNENLTIVATDSATGQLLGACINVIAVKSEKEETLEDYVDKYKVGQLKSNDGHNFKHFSL